MEHELGADGRAFKRARRFAAKKSLKAKKIP